MEHSWTLTLSCWRRDLTVSRDRKCHPVSLPDPELLMFMTKYRHEHRLTNMGLKNKAGVDIKDYWADGVKTYLGMMFNGFPNAFTCYTPHGIQL
jgi:cation diffusion facilitator CzcD-associated flavoprotein CzcO